MPKKATEEVIRPVTSFLFKGHNGTGKTIAATCKEFRPVYAFNCEGRMESAVRYHRNRNDADDIEWDDFPIGSGYYGIDKRMDQLVASCPYKTVLMSSLKSFIDVIMHHLIQEAFGRKNQQGQPSVLRIGGIPVNQLPDYNAEDSAIINDLIAAFQQLKARGVNVILEAHIIPYDIVSIENGQRVVTTINQLLTKGKKAPASIPIFFNEIYLFEKEFEGWGKPAKYKVNTIGNSTDSCKTSWGIESFDWTNQDFSQLLFKQLSKEILDTPREDPDAPKLSSFGG